MEIWLQAVEGILVITFCILILLRYHRKRKRKAAKRDEIVKATRRYVKFRAGGRVFTIEVRRLGVPDFLCYVLLEGSEVIEHCHICAPDMFRLLARDKIGGRFYKVIQAAMQLCFEKQLATHASKKIYDTF